MPRMAPYLALVLLGAIATAPTALAAVTVQTPLGPVLGFTQGGADQFLGIRYGQVPTRFEVAQPEPAWGNATTYNATVFGATCIQHVDPHAALGVPMAEDCLYLNVYRPAAAPDGAAVAAAPLPVAFWIHGGAFEAGAGSAFNGTYLSTTQKLVVVTINYRLGPLGFMVTDGSGRAGMNGIADQALALKWVANNIASFGGDPDDVTVLGESAGSLSTCYLGVSPLAQGLMKRVLLESGACTGQRWGPNLNTSLGYAWADYVATAVLKAPNVSALKDRSTYKADDMVWPLPGTYPSSAPEPPGITLDFGPVMPQPPRALYAAGGDALNFEAMVAGGNTFDGLGPWYYPFHTVEPSLFPTTMAEYQAYIDANVPAHSAAVLAAYHPDRFNGSVPAAFVQLVGDACVVCPTKDLLATVNKHLPSQTFMYLYAHLYAIDMAVYTHLVQVGANSSFWASHASELSFVWRMPYDYDNPHGVTYHPFTDEELALSESMQGYWGSFVRGAKPQGAVAWPPVSVPSSSPMQPAQVANVMRLAAGDSLTQVLASYHDKECAALGEVW